MEAKKSSALTGFSFSATFSSTFLEWPFLLLPTLEGMNSSSGKSIDRTRNLEKLSRTRHEQNLGRVFNSGSDCLPTIHSC
jgi:hypothetical protein